LFTPVSLILFFCFIFRFPVEGFIKNIQNTAFRYGLWAKGSGILVGVSGGPDSVCLLDVLSTLRKKYDWKLAVAHVNYGLRGHDSEEDERFVRSLGERYGTACFVLRTDIGKDRSNLEKRLRDIRYRFFEEVRREQGLDAIAVGHNLDDQAETVLIRLLRGSGTLGLQAMRPRNGRVIRPLLLTSRREIEKHLHKRQLSFRTDSTNAEQHFARNRIRHTLIPFLEERFNPGIRETLARTALILAEDYAAMQEQLPELGSFRLNGRSASFSASELSSLPEGFRKAILRHYLNAIGTDASGMGFGQAEELLKIVKSTKNKSQTLSFGRLKILRKGDTVTMILAEK
jgi:tRNA(Ile)-lysidine synthase